MSISKEADRIRCVNDRDLCDSLLTDRTVKRVNEQITRMEEKTPSGVRRRLLATSVRLSKRMAPDLHKMADGCIEKLGMEIPLELYVFASPQYNAMCFKPQDGRLFVMFASSLLEAFDESELRFVMGHELGHHVYQHHDIPIGYILRGDSRPDPRLAMQLFTWSRYAEISADRAGAHCAQDMHGVASALFKLASGLTSKTIQFNMDDFLKQVDEMQLEDDEPGQGAPKEDWFSTHPFSPLRVRALKLFDESSFMKDGKGAFSAELDLDALDRDLEERIASVKEHSSTPQAMQVLRDLCLVARAEGESSDAETAVLERVADGLGIARSFVCTSLEADVTPD